MVGNVEFLKSAVPLETEVVFEKDALGEMTTSAQQAENAAGSFIGVNMQMITIDLKAMSMIAKMIVKIIL